MEEGLRRCGRAAHREPPEYIPLWCTQETGCALCSFFDTQARKKTKRSESSEDERNRQAKAQVRVITQRQLRKILCYFKAPTRTHLAPSVVGLLVSGLSEAKGSAAYGEAALVGTRG